MHSDIRHINTLRKLMIRAQGLVKCVGLGFMLGLEKEK